MPNIGNVTITDDNTGALNKMRDDFVARVAEHNNVDLMATDKAWASENTATGKTIQTILGDDYGDATIQEQGNALWNANAKGLKALLEAEGVDYSTLEPEVVATLDALANIHGPSGVMKKLSNPDDATAMLAGLKDWNGGNLFSNIDNIDGTPDNLMNKIVSTITPLVSGTEMGRTPEGDGTVTVFEDRIPAPGAEARANAAADEDFVDDKFADEDATAGVDSTDTAGNVPAPPAANTTSLRGQLDAARVMIAHGHAQRHAAIAGITDNVPEDSNTPAMEALAREVGKDIIPRLDALETAEKHADDAEKVLTALQTQIQELPDDSSDKVQLQSLFNGLSLALADLNTKNDAVGATLQTVAVQIQQLSQARTPPRPWESRAFLRTYAQEVSGVERANRRQNEDDPDEEFYGKHRLPESFIRNTYGPQIVATLELNSAEDIEDKHIHALEQNPRRFGLEKDAPLKTYMALARDSLIRTLGEAGYTELELSGDRPAVMAAFEIAMAKQAGYLADNRNVGLTQDQKDNVITFFKNELARQDVEMIDITPFTPAQVINTNETATT